MYAETSFNPARRTTPSIAAHASATARTTSAHSLALLASALAVHVALKYSSNVVTPMRSVIFSLMPCGDDKPIRENERRESE
jgi:hypothetical protein